MSIEQKKKNRFLFLKHLYDSSDGDTSITFDTRNIGKKLQLNYDETSQIVDYLIGEYLIESRALGIGLIGLTHWGIKEVEQAIENPSKPTEHFLPINFISIGTMKNSTLQQGTSNSTINFNYNTQTAVDIEKIVSQLNDIKDSLNLSNELQSELLSELETIEIQKKSSNPKSIIIAESLKSIRAILESITANALTPVIIDQITKLIG